MRKLRKNTRCPFKREEKANVSSCTTYTHYYKYPRKGKAAVRVRSPISAFPPSDQKMPTETTYHTYYKNFNEKDRLACRGELIVRPSQILVSQETFDGKSEAKNAFQHPRRLAIIQMRKKNYRYHPPESFPTKPIERETPWAETPTQINRTTTYFSTFKKPKNFKPSEKIIPKKGELSLSSGTMKGKSRYREDFTRKPLIKREIPKWQEKTMKYRPAEIPMESMTNYRSDYIAGVHSIRKPTKWRPNHPIYNRGIRESSNANSDSTSCSCSASTSSNMCRASNKQDKILAIKNTAECGDRVKPEKGKHENCYRCRSSSRQTKSSMKNSISDYRNKFRLGNHGDNTSCFNNGSDNSRDEIGSLQDSLKSLSLICCANCLDANSKNTLILSC